jgi:hypothetical protein
VRAGPSSIPATRRSSNRASSPGSMSRQLPLHAAKASREALPDFAYDALESIKACFITIFSCFGVNIPAHFSSYSFLYLTLSSRSSPQTSSRANAIMPEYNRVVHCCTKLSPARATFHMLKNASAPSRLDRHRLITSISPKSTPLRNKPYFTQSRGKRAFPAMQAISLLEICSAGFSSENLELVRTAVA